MKISLEHAERRYAAELNHGISIAIPMIPGATGPNCFYAPLFEALPVRVGTFVGSIEEGGSVNFFNLHINPHGNGTHTECVGHIASGTYYIKDSLIKNHFIGKLLSVWPEKNDDGDRIITAALMDAVQENDQIDAVIVRTLPNHPDKKSRMYSGTNPPYFAADAIARLNLAGVKHLLTDLPSVDREEDEGRLAAHKMFWNYPENPEVYKTITELVFIPDEVPDGLYLINIQTLPLQSDASPSQVVLYALNEIPY
jgi:arylformamidase